jgi:hypothetical protein
MRLSLADIKKMPAVEIVAVLNEITVINNASTGFG